MAKVNPRIEKKQIFVDELENSGLRKETGWVMAGGFSGAGTAGYRWRK